MTEENIVLNVANLGKQYRLGLIGTGTLSHDLNRWWYRIRGKQDPYLKIGETNDRASKGASNYVWALNDITFQVKQGEVLGIIGKNGAGKSTLLKILSKVTSPTKGKIQAKGRIASLLEVGTGFHPELTGKENIFLNGAILGMTKSEINAKLDEIIEFSGCQRYIDTPVKRYSSGMKVRLAFAVAAHLEPEILIVDEVLAVGDVEFQKKAIGKMQDISKGEGRTILFVSHDMNAIKNLCTRVIILQNGEVSFNGDKDVAIDTYINSNLQQESNTKELKKGNFEIKAFHMSTEKGVIEAFKPITFTITLHFVHDIPLDLELSLYAKDQFGRVISVMSTWLNSNNLKPKNNTIDVTCELSHGFSFIEGNYSFDLKVKGSKEEFFEDIYTMEQFNSPTTHYKRKVRSDYHGITYTPNKWEIIKQ